MSGSDPSALDLPSSVQSQDVRGTGSGEAEPSRRSPRTNHALLHFLDGHYIERHTIDPVASGGFCDVFTGDHDKYGKVAMKRPRITVEGGTESQLRTFLVEAKIWKCLRHPNILPFVGMILSDSRIWLVSPFADNGSLPTYLRVNTQADRRRLVFQFTEALAYLHSRDVVHGDIKGGNILISAEGNVLLSDFGLAKLMNGSMVTDTSLKDAGTRWWMAPELLKEANPSKPFATDVYAFGITIYEILSGKKPFDHYQNDLIAIRVIPGGERPGRDPPSGEPYVQLWEVAEECWDMDASKRPEMTVICDRFGLSRPIAENTATSESVHSPDMDLRPLNKLVNGPTEREQSSSTRLGTDSEQDDSYLLQTLGDAAFGDEGYLQKDGLCLEGTRGETLEKLDKWADDTSSAKVLLLKGQAGRGKSTIARTSASRFRAWWRGDVSCAIFHFRRGNDALNTRVVCALARQLVLNGNQCIRNAILRAIQEDKDVAHSRLEDQFRTLLVRPLADLESDPPRILFIIDALDECKDHKFITTLLNLIHSHSSSFPATVKFLLTSRPEPHIVRRFHASNKNWIQENLDNLDPALVTRDVRAYLAHGLRDIGEDQGLEDGWFPSNAVDQLVALSQGLFQWAHTAIQYIDGAPKPRLKRLISLRAVCDLSELYNQIVSEAFSSKSSAKDPDLPGMIHHVLGILVVSPRPISLADLGYLWLDSSDQEELLDAAEVIRMEVLNPLASMIMVPESPDEPIYFMHTSVRDFLTDTDDCRDQQFFVDSAAHHARAAAVCFDRMKRDLKRDICGINDPKKTNAEVQDLVKKHVPSGLRYCCRSWSSHLSEVPHNGTHDGCKKVHSSLDEFCNKLLLHWLEVLSLIDAVPEAITTARQGKEWLQIATSVKCNTRPTTANLLDDIVRFCRLFFAPISISAQHIIHSVLHHCPRKTELWAAYGFEFLSRQRTPQIIRGPVHQSWSNTLWSASGNLNWVDCVSFSPDGRLLASGSHNNTIQLWDAETGKRIGEPLTGHSHYVASVSFSPDGKLLASGSWDKTIRFWDVETGRQIGEPLVGHSGWVMSVSFSPDGKLLASGSRDKTILFWDVEAGKQVGEPLISHSKEVASVSFSPDGKLLASGSDDNTIQLWNVETRTQTGEPLVGHSSSVKSVSFSPDSKLLASGSDDNKTMLWDVDTRKEIGKPLVGHSEMVASVSFSPDGKLLVSGSSDKTIRLWDVEAGKQIAEPLVGHSGWVTSVSFSPYGKFLASGSEDGTIRLWDVETEKQTGEPLIDHSKSVEIVSFSLDGNLLASGSADNTIRLWATGTGEQIGKLLVGHSGTIRSLSFSPDNTLLVSGSSDKTIRLWDAKTGMQVGKPLVGHSEWVMSVSFSPDGRLLVSGCWGGTVRLWDVETRKQIGEPLVGHSKAVWSVSFSPDGKLLVSGSLDTTIRLWDVETRTQIVEPLVGHQEEVISVSFSPDGKLLASGSDDKTIRLWDVKTGKQIGEPLVGHSVRVTSMSFSPDGKSIFSGAEDEIMAWRVPETAREESSRINPTIKLYARYDEVENSGWVFCNGARRFWLPPEFCRFRGIPARLSLFGNILVIYDPHIHILDISDCM